MASYYLAKLSLSQYLDRLREIVRLILIHVLMIPKFCQVPGATTPTRTGCERKNYRISTAIRTSVCFSVLHKKISRKIRLQTHLINYAYQLEHLLTSKRCTRILNMFEETLWRPFAMAAPKEEFDPQTNVLEGAVIPQIQVTRTDRSQHNLMPF